jgi:CHAT domain-containing protein
LTVLGATVTVIGGGAVTVTAAEPLLVLSACETAVTVTVAGAGTDAGAV